MRKMIRLFFHRGETEKISEKMIVAHLVYTVLVIVFCLVAMSVSAFAYFSHNVTSHFNVIKAADFETKISIEIMDENNQVQQITPVTSNYKVMKVSQLETGKYYTVTIEPTGRSTAKTGFVILRAEGCPDVYHTQQLGFDETLGGETPSLSFRFMITSSTDVIFEAHWGTSSHYPDYQNKGEACYIVNGEEVKLIVDGITDPVPATKEEETLSKITPETTTPLPTPETTVPSVTTTPPQTEEMPQTETTVTTSTEKKEKENVSSEIEVF